MIELKNLTKRYGNTLAVNRLSLAVAKGEIYGFI
ncbi:MAG TPA: ABC transporter ATP-binding protein, partial [Syntrophaceae bacterium]|nr:ABC transporter ATP-binding protein [Syntrophaceae bacterium]